MALHCRKGLLLKVKEHWNRRKLDLEKQEAQGFSPLSKSVWELLSVLTLDS